MRNLKKVLSLALALVMLVGMMVVGAGATSFKDDASIKNQEAVDVVSGLEVLLGDETGNFNPQGNLTRAQAATVIAKLDLGAAFGNLVTTNASSFSDVAANYWGKPYIDYCAARGLILGVGGGRYDPEASVTGVQFALMVCRVLGYEDANERITGANWETAAAALARKAGLTNNVALNSQPMTRDDMAQVAYNALQADMVEYDGRAISINGVYIPAGKAEAVKGTGSDYRIGTVSNDTKQLCEEKFPGLKTQPATNALGDKVNTFLYNNVELTDTAVTPLATFTADLTGASDTTVQKALSTLKVDGTVPTVITKDGDKTHSVTWNTGTTNRDKIINGIKSETGNGTVVNVYIDADRNVTDVAVYTPKAAEVTRKVTVSGSEAVTLSVYGGGAVTVNKTGTNKDFFDTLYALETGDYTMLALNGTTILDVLPFDQVSGKFTAYTGSSIAAASSFSIDGTKYTKAAGYAANTTEPTALNQDVIAIVDQYNYVKGFAKSAAVVENFGYTVAANMFGNFQSGVSYQAQLVLSDGTVEAVELAKVDGAAPTAGISSSLAGKPVAYSVDSDGKYSVTVLAQSVDLFTGVDGATTKGSITKGDPQLKESTNVKAIANNKTIFLVIGGTSAAPTYTTYVGVNNVPTMTNVVGTAYKKAAGAFTSTSVADLVVIKSSSVSNAVKSYIYYLKDTPESVTTDGKVYKAIVDGAETTVTVDADTAVTVGLYTDPGYDTKDVITSVGTVVNASAEYVACVTSGGVKLDGGLLTVGGISKTYVVAEDFVSYVIDYTGKVTYAALDTSAQYVGAKAYISVKDGLATGVYIQTADSRADAGSMTGGTTKSFEAGAAADSTTFDIDLTNGTVGTIAYSKSGVVTASVDPSGNVTLTPVAAGTATVTIPVNPKDSTTHKAVDLTIAVTVKAYAAVIGNITGDGKVAQAAVGGTPAAKKQTVTITLNDKSVEARDITVTNSGAAKFTVGAVSVTDGGAGNPNTCTLTVEAAKSTTDTGSFTIAVAAHDTDNYSNVTATTINVTVENQLT